MRGIRPIVRLEVAGLVLVLVAQAVLFGRLLHAATSYDEDVYLAAVDALRHGQALGSDVFAAQWPGFYDLLRSLTYVTGISVPAIRAGLLGVTLLGTVGGWLVGRRYGGPVGGLLVALLLTIAPPLDLFGSQVIADTPSLAFGVLAIGLATLPGGVAAIAAGAVFGLALSIKLTAVTVALPVVVLLRGRTRHAALGAILVWAVLLVAHARALGSLWTQGVTYHEQARSTPAVMPHPYHRMFSQMPLGTPFVWLAIAAVALAAALLAGRRLTTWPLWGWVGLELVFLLTQKPLHDNHLIVFPFALAVASGATIGDGVRRLRGRGWIAAGAVLAALAAGGWIQQLHRVDVARAPEPAGNVAAARALARLVPSGASTVDDRPIVSFLAHRRVYGPLVDTALLQFETGSLTDRKVIAALPKVGAVVVSRELQRRPAVMAWLRTHARLRYRDAGVRIYTPRR